MKFAAKRMHRIKEPYQLKYGYQIEFGLVNGALAQYENSIVGNSYLFQKFTSFLDSVYYPKQNGQISCPGLLHKTK